MKTFGEPDDHRTFRRKPPARQPGHERLRLTVQIITHVKQPIDHLAQARRRSRTQHIFNGGALFFEPVLRQITPINLPQIIAAILKVVQNLKRGAKSIGRGEHRAILPMQIEEELTHRICGHPTITNELVKARIARLHRVLAKRVKKISTPLNWHIGFKKGRTQRLGLCQPPRLAAQHLPVGIEPEELLFGGELFVVADVVSRARKIVVSRNMRTQRRRDQERAHREVLIPRTFARPRLNGVVGINLGHETLPQRIK